MCSGTAVEVQPLSTIARTAPRPSALRNPSLLPKCARSMLSGVASGMAHMKKEREDREAAVGHSRELLPAHREESRDCHADRDGEHAHAADRAHDELADGDVGVGGKVGCSVDRDVDLAHLGGNRGRLVLLLRK